MTKKEFAQFAMALKTYYPRETLLPNDKAMELWFMQLQDIPYQIAEASLNKWVATNKWSPSIADIREMASSVSHGDIPEWGAGWQTVLDAIRKYGTYNEPKAMQMIQEQNEIAYHCTQRLGFKNLCLSERIETDRANFRMMYEQYAERKQRERQLPQGLKQLIGQIRSDQLLIEGGSEQ